MFPDPDFEDLYGFITLHKAVLGLTNDTLDQILSNDPCAIDTTDQLGRSALSWAARRGDCDAIDFLLSHGARVNQVNQWGNSPLMIAASEGRFDCVSMLLRAGANATSPNRFGVTALHAVAQSGPQPLTREPMDYAIECLLDAGSDLNAKCDEGIVPLLQAVYCGEVETVESLLAHGADHDIQDITGYNALSAALRNKRHEILKLLLRRGADHTGCLADFGTLTHLIAQVADVQTLRLLISHRLKPRDINTKYKGLTPLEVAFKREDIDAEWRDLFVQFLKSIDKNMVQP